jgi:hypothetical protein
MKRRTFGSLRESDRGGSTSMPRKAAQNRRLCDYFTARPASCRTPIRSVHSKIMRSMFKLDSHFLKLCQYLNKPGNICIY